MTTLSNKELSAIANIGRLSQECASEEQFGQIMTREMLRIFDSRSAVFLEFESHDKDLAFGELASYGLDNVHTVRYRDHYHKMDPCYIGFQELWEQQRFPAVSTDQVIDSEHAYINSEYYQDFLQPTRVHQSLIFGLGNPRSLNGLVGLHRHKGQDTYSEADHMKIRLVAPYLATAIMYRQKQRTVHRQNALKDLILRSSNVRGYILLNDKLICVDSGGELTTISSLADTSHAAIRRKSIAHLLPDSVVDYIFEMLRGCHAADRQTETFDNLIIGDHVRATMVREEDGQTYILLSFLNPEIQMTSKDRMRFFNLTRRQQDVVHLVELGLTNQQIAATLQISFKTVENHLTQIYEKTQTHNKTSLLRQLFV